MSNPGFSNFEYDSANNFISDIILNGYGLIGIALERITDEAETPDIIACEEALIAAEIIAAAGGQPAEDFPENAGEWIAIDLPQGRYKIKVERDAGPLYGKIITQKEINIDEKGGLTML